MLRESAHPPHGVVPMATSVQWKDDYRAFLRKLSPEMDYREGVGHFLFLEKPKEFKEATLEFLGKW